MIPGWRLEKLSPSGISWTRVADYYSRQAAESGMRLRAGPRSSYRVIACWLPEQSAAPAVVRGGFSRQSGLIVDVLLMLMAAGAFGAFFTVAGADWDCHPSSASWSRAACEARRAPAVAPVAAPSLPDVLPAAVPASAASVDVAGRWITRCLWQGGRHVCFPQYV